MKYKTLNRSELVRELKLMGGGETLKFDKDYHYEITKSEEDSEYFVESYYVNYKGQNNYVDSLWLKTQKAVVEHCFGKKGEE